MMINASDPSTLNGGSAMAMSGKRCVALAVDKRFGSGPQMVNISPRRVLILHSHLMIAFTGLQSDVESVAEELSVQATKRTGRGSSFGFSRLLRKETLEKSDMPPNDNDDVGWINLDTSSSYLSPRAMSTLTSHVLYSRRRAPYYCEPLLVGLEPISNLSTIKQEPGTTIKYRPFLCAQDVIGAKSQSRDFACIGAASSSMYGIAEAMWRPDMDAETLAKVCGRAFLSALERDCLSGYGAVVYVLTEDGGIIEYDLDARND